MKKEEEEIDDDDKDEDEFTLDEQVRRLRVLVLNTKPNIVMNNNIEKHYPLNKNNVREAFFNFTVFGLKRSGKSTLLNTFVVALSPPEVKVKNWYHARVTVKDNIEGDGTLEYSFVDISQDVPSCMIHFYDTRGFFGQWEKERRQFDQITNGKATNNTIVEEKNTRTWIEWLCRKKSFV